MPNYRSCKRATIPRRPGLISLGLAKDLHLAITVCMTFEMAGNRLKRKVELPRIEPRAFVLPCQQPPLFLALM